MGTEVGSIRANSRYSIDLVDYGTHTAVVVRAKYYCSWKHMKEAPLCQKDSQSGFGAEVSGVATRRCWRKQKENCQKPNTGWYIWGLVGILAGFWSLKWFWDEMYWSIEALESNKFILGCQDWSTCLQSRSWWMMRRRSHCLSNHKLDSMTWEAAYTTFFVSSLCQDTEQIPGFCPGLEFLYTFDYFTSWTDGLSCFSWPPCHHCTVCCTDTTWCLFWGDAREVLDDSEEEKLNEVATDLAVQSTEGTLRRNYVSIISWLWRWGFPTWSFSHDFSKM